MVEGESVMEKKNEKHMYHIYDTISQRTFFVLVRSFKMAENKVRNYLQEESNLKPQTNFVISKCSQGFQEVVSEILTK
jgi:stalled ribosome rescue protein Dom34